MKGAPPTRHGQISDMQVIINCVDQRGRELDQQWGIGRLPMLVPIEWAERFHAQHKLFNAAVWEFDLLAVRQHGNAMLRAYDRLDELALILSAGLRRILPEQSSSLSAQTRDSFVDFSPLRSGVRRHKLRNRVGG